LQNSLCLVQLTTRPSQSDQVLTVHKGTANRGVHLPQPGGCAARLFGSRWTIQLIRELADGPRRFGQLKSGLGRISPRTLVDRLRWLEAEGIVLRAAFPEIPPRVEYRLTEKGQGLRPILLAMRQYEEAWAQD